MTDTTHLAHTIPPDVIRNAGEPVFPELRRHILGSVRLRSLIDAREQYGIAKYGQTLMTDDSRDTPTEICNEAADLLAYVTKLAMQRQSALAWDLIAVTVDFVDDLLATMEDIESETQP
jgi:hypothetical protein